MADFQSKVERWRRIARGEEGYGDDDTTPRQCAAAYHRNELLAECAKRAREAHPPELRSVDLLVSLSGFTPATTILSFEILRPKRLVVISSSKSLESVDIIGRWVVERGGLSYSSFRHESTDPSTPLAIYEIVRRHLNDGASSDDGGVVVLDITGGKKVMSATAALAAWQLDLRLSYVDGEWDPDLRTATPGTEHLLLLDNPTTLFGAEELRRVRELFDNGAFDVAQERATELADRLANPSEARGLRALAGFYAAWLSFDFVALEQRVAALERVLHDNPSVLLAQRPRIDTQLQFIRRLVKHERFIVLVNHFVLGRHYADHARHDFAAFLFYRTLEGVLVEAVKRACPHAVVAEGLVDPVLLEDETTARFEQIAAELFGDEPIELPRRLGFMNAAILLQALQSPLLSRADVEGTRGLGHLRDLARARNRSILAHGFERVTEEQSRQLEAKARLLLRALAEDLEDRPDVDALVERLAFVRVGEDR